MYIILTIIVIVTLLVLYSLMKMSSDMSRLEDEQAERLMHRSPTEEELEEELEEEQAERLKHRSPTEEELLQQRQNLQDQIKEINNQLAEIGISKIQAIEHKTQEALDKGGNNV